MKSDPTKNGFSIALSTLPIPLDGSSVGLQINWQQQALDSIMRMGSSFSNDHICVQLFENEGVKHLFLHMKRLNFGAYLDPTVF
jgi:hypothetical protein